MPVKIVKQWNHRGSPRGTNILWITITVNFWDSVSKLFRFKVLLISKLCSFSLVPMLSQNTKYFFLSVSHMLSFHNFGFPLWIPSLLPWFSQRLHKAGLRNFPLKKLSSHFLKNAPDTLSKVNSVCQQFEEMFGITLQADTTESQRTRSWKAGLKGKDKLSWKQKDIGWKSGKDRLPAVTKIKEHVPKWNWRR